MDKDLSDVLVIGVSSRALFDLDDENEIFVKEGIAEYRKYQLENENILLKKGTAFNLVESLLSLNEKAKKRIVEVVVMSKNSPETGVRMLNSIAEYKLNISRIALSGGEALSPYIEAYAVDLFLSKDEKDIQKIIDSNKTAAAIICPPPENFSSCDSRVKIAFDADAVIFSENSEIRFKTEGLEAFEQYEKEHTEEPLEEGPFANLLKKLSKIQSYLDSSIEYSPLRLAIVTARTAPSHMRVIKTLRKWGVYVDEVYFLGGIAKDKVLKSFGAQIFFDDQESHLNTSSKVVPSAKVPYKTNSPLSKLKGKK
ncbi:MAG: 5'-nucleotidase [Opitutales bacterium]